MVVYTVIATFSEFQYTRAIFEDKKDAEMYIDYLKTIHPERTYEIGIEPLIPKGYGQYWKEQADKGLV